MSFNLSKIKEYLPTMENMTFPTMLYYLILHVLAASFLTIWFLTPNIHDETMKQLPKVNHIEDLVIIDYNAELDTYQTCRAIRDYLDQEHENNHFVQYEIFPRHCLNVKL